MATLQQCIRLKPTERKKEIFNFDFSDFCVAKEKKKKKNANAFNVRNTYIEQSILIEKSYIFAQYHRSFKLLLHSMKMKMKMISSFISRETKTKTKEKNENNT